MTRTQRDYVDIVYNETDSSHTNYPVQLASYLCERDRMKLSRQFPFFGVRVPGCCPLLNSRVCWHLVFYVSKVHGSGFPTKSCFSPVPNKPLGITAG